MKLNDKARNTYYDYLNVCRIHVINVKIFSNRITKNSEFKFLKLLFIIKL